MKILAVDDEGLALSRLCRLLNELGYHDITQASSAEEALKYATEKSFDVAFLDIWMSDMNGIELGYALHENNPNLAIIYQTAHDKHALEAFNVGALNYLLKPYTKEDVERSLSRVNSTPQSPELRFIAHVGDTQKLLAPNDIFYVQADLSEVILRTKEDFCYYPKKISDIEPLLEAYGFLRIHRSFLINLNTIYEMETVEQSRIRFYFKGIKESIESSKDGAKHFRHLFK